MTYDALLTLRGWTPDHFARASGTLLRAARWALFAEAGVKWWDNAKQAARTPLPPVGGDMKTFAEAGEVRAQGVKEMARLRPLLFPEDDDE